MGNPNSRSKKVAGTKKSHSAHPSSASSCAISLGSHTQSSNTNSVEGQAVNGFQDLKVSDSVAVQRPELKFKSFKNATLITPNLVPPGQPLIPEELMQSLPRPAEMGSKYTSSGATPQSSTNVPAADPTGGNRGKVQNGRRINENATPSSAAGNPQRVKRSPNEAPAAKPMTPAQKLATQHGFPGAGPQNASTSPRTPNGARQPVPKPAPRKPRTFLTRRDKAHRDFIIRASGVERNLTKVTEGYLPNGLPYQQSSNNWVPEKYDLVADFKSMTPEQQVELLANRQVEILVEIKAGFEEALKGGAAKKPEGTITTAVSPTTTVIDRLKELGPAFTNLIRVLTIILDFKSVSPAGNTTSAPPTGPSSNTISHPPANTGPLPSGPDYEFLAELTTYINTFPFIEKLTVVIQTGASGDHKDMPVTLPQLSLVLPFYGLDFVNWDVQRKTPSKTRTSPLQRWSIKWMNKERNRISREEECKQARTENAFVVRPSADLFHQHRST